jgi:tetratricopeptide (TPR) repeat protein
MSKPTTTPLPLVMLLMDVWPLGRWSRRAVLEKAPFFALAAASAAITYISQLRAGDLASAGAYPAWATPLIVCHNIVFYLHKVLWPLSLSAHYPWPAPFSLMHPAVCVGLIGTLALLCGLILSLRWTRAFMVSWLMFFVSLLPAIGIVGFTVAIAADRFAYLPKVFLLPPIVWLLTRMGGQETESRMRSWAGAALIVLAAAGEAVSTRNYLVQWKDTESLARYQAHYAPQSAFVQTSLANILAGRGKWAEAADAYQKAIALENDAAAHSGLAAILADQGRVDEAELHLREAVRLYPSDVDSQANLAAILDRRGRPDEALTQIEKAVAAMPRSAGPYYQYAMILFRRGRLDEAAAQFQKALAIDPRDAYSLYQYGCLLLSRGNVADGVRQWEAALAIKPDWLELLNNLAWIWATSDDEEYRQPKRARRLARRACELTSNLDPSLLDTLAAAYAADFHFEDAVPAARLSIERWTALGNMQSAEQVRRRLELYEKRRPYREPVKSEAYRAK